MSAEKCVSCEPVIQCCSGGNVFSYSLTNGLLLSNEQTGFVFECPPGFTCAPGVYPLSVNIPANTVEYTIPPSAFLSFPPPLVLQCPGGAITVTIPPGYTQAQIIALARQMVAQCVRNTGIIIANPPRRYLNTFWNNSQSVQLCFDPNTLSGSIGSPYSISGNSVVIGSGVVPSTVSQADADNMALSMVVDAGNAALASGGLVCNPPPTNIFSALVWNNPPDVQLQTNGGIASQDVFSGGTVNFSTSCVGVGASNGTLDNSNTGVELPYAGPNINCNVKLVINTNTPDSVHSRMRVSVSQDGNPLVDTGFESGNGTFNFPFIISATSGSLIEVDYQQRSAATGDLAANFMTVELTLTST